MQDNHQWIAYKNKPMIIELNVEIIKQNSEKFDSETSNLQPVNLSEVSREVHNPTPEVL